MGRGAHPRHRGCAGRSPSPSRLPNCPLSSPSLTIDFPANFYFHSPEGKGLLLGWSDTQRAGGLSTSGFRTRGLDCWAWGRSPRPAPRRCWTYGISAGWAGLYEITPDCNQIIAVIHRSRRTTHRHGLLRPWLPDGPGHRGDRARPLSRHNKPGYDIGSFALDRFARTDISRWRIPTSSDRRPHHVSSALDMTGVHRRTAGSCRADRRLTHLGKPSRAVRLFRPSRPRT